MKSTRWMRSLYGLALLIFGGCMAPGPYSYGTYPGYYAAPPQSGFVAPPGTPMVPGPSYPAPQLGPATPVPGPITSPNSPGWSPLPAPATPLPGGFNGGPAPFGSPPPGSARRPDVLVPNPVEPSPGPSPAPMGPGPGPNAAPFGTKDGPPTFDGTQMTIPQRTDAPPQSFAAVGTEAFQSPVEPGADLEPDRVVAVASKAVSDKMVSDKAGAASPGPYDYDRASYSWLRGVVDFEPRDNSWHIIYSPKPDREDKYGGAFRLTDNPKLKGLHPGDFVYIEGRVKPKHLDPRGKPHYEIEGDQLVRITDGAKQSAAN